MKLFNLFIDEKLIHSFSNKIALQNYINTNNIMNYEIKETILIENWEKIEETEIIGTPAQGYPNHIVFNNGTIYSKYSKRFLAQNETKHGYLFIHLRRRKSSSIHRLVAENFLENLENKEDVNHIDGNKRNNNISNLEWTSRSENLKHAFKLGLRSLKGELHNKAILSEIEVLQIREDYSKGKYKQKELAKKYGVTEVNISCIVTRKSWKHI